MKKIIIADTSGLYALADARDPNHFRAAAFLTSLSPGKDLAEHKLVVSNHVFDELMTLTKVRLGMPAALQLGIRLRNSRFVEMVIFTQAQEQALWRLFSRYNDKAWSYTDCACLLLAQEYDTSLAFSFDHHFRQLGFKTASRKVDVG